MLITSPFEDGETVFVIVEEYIPGETLKKKIEDEEFGIELGIQVAKSLLRVLIEFDENDIIHRDIKPSNIMIDGEDNIKLLDVGVARFVNKESLTADDAGYGPGTKGYRAPEQIQNKKHQQDIRTDMFSVGIVMYEAITGEHPFGVEPGSRTEAILEGRRSELQDSLDNPELNAIYSKLTEHEQHNRYRKPEFALEELEMVEGDFDVQ